MMMSEDGYGWGEGGGVEVMVEMLMTVKDDGDGGRCW
jgi:hypothetical protein